MHYLFDLNRQILLLLLSSCFFGLASEFNHASISIITNNNVIYYMANYIVWCIFPLFMSFIIGPIIDIYSKKYIIIISLFINSFVVYGYLFSYYNDNIFLLLLTSCVFYTIDNTIVNSIFSYIPELVNIKDLIIVNSIDASISKITPIFGMVIGGLVLYYTNICINIILTCSLLIFSSLFLFLINKTKEKQNVIHQIEIPDTQIIVIQKEEIKEKNFCEMNDECMTYICSDKYISFLIFYKGLINILLGSFAMVNYNNSYVVFSNNKYDGVKLFVLSNSIDALFSIIVQCLFQHTVNNDMEKIKKSLKFTIIPIIASIICYLFSNNIYLWFLGIIIFGCSDIIIFTIISSIMQSYVDKNIQGRVFTVGYNFRVFLCSIGSIIVSLAIYYKYDLQKIFFIYLVVYIYIGAVSFLHIHNVM